MNDKLNLLLNQIKINETTYFEGGKLEKIICNKAKDKYVFCVSLNKPLPVNLYENFNKIAKEIECEIEKNIISPLSKELDILIQEVENTIDKNNKINDNCKLAMEQARNLKIKCDNLIQSIDI